MTVGTAVDPAGIPGFPDAVVALAGAGDMAEFTQLQWRAFETALHEPIEVLSQDVLGATTWLVRDSAPLVGSVRCEVHGEFAKLDRKSVVLGKGVSVRVKSGSRRIITKTKTETQTQH